MNLLTRLYNWLSSKTPANPNSLLGEIKEHRAKRLLLNSNPEFLQWAFGDHHEYLSIEDKMNYWNLTHGNLFKVEQSDHLPDMIIRMGSCWAEFIAIEEKMNANSSK